MRHIRKVTTMSTNRLLITGKSQELKNHKVTDIEEIVPLKKSVEIMLKIRNRKLETAFILRRNSFALGTHSGKETIAFLLS